MIRSAFLILASTIGLSVCASSAAAAPPSAAFLAARLLSDPPAEPKTAALLADSSGPRRLPRATPRTSRAPSPLVRVEAANRKAVREPAGDFYVGAVQVYPWVEGNLYRLYTAPEQVSDIALQPGESLISVAAGDTARWVIGDTASGSGTARRTHILVKPSAAGLSTNLVIATDHRVYHLELESNARSAMASISWTYPEDALLALRAASPGAIAETVAAGVAVEALDFNYRIEGDRPPWRPLRAFDDGRQVFIEFPPTLPQGEAPPLFVRGEGGRAELVNYRLRGRYYVVDRLFAVAELRLGETRQQVVRIVRDGPKRWRRAS
jgi:type IV secretion system protein VirB9